MRSPLLFHFTYRLFGTSSPVANEDYWLCYFAAQSRCTLAHQRTQNRSAIMEQWQLSCEFITHARNLVQGEIPITGRAHHSNDSHWRLIPTLTHHKWHSCNRVMRAANCTATLPPIAAQFIASRYVCISLTSARSNDLHALFPIRS